MVLRKADARGEHQPQRNVRAIKGGVLCEGKLASALPSSLPKDICVLAFVQFVLFYLFGRVPDYIESNYSRRC